MSALNAKFGHYLHCSQSRALLREWQSRGNTSFKCSDFVLPLFIIDGEDDIQPIASMPSVSRMGLNVCVQYLRPLIEEHNLSAVLLFPVIDGKRGKQLSDALDDNRNAVLKLIPKLKREFANLLVIVDVCLCAFSADGHCCVYDQQMRIDNERSVEMLSEIAVKYASVGADVVAPSDMMDTRVATIRAKLNANKYNDVAILSYSAKFQSHFYGPFRDAAGNGLHLILS